MSQNGLPEYYLCLLRNLNAHADFHTWDRLCLQRPPMFHELPVLVTHSAAVIIKRLQRRCGRPSV